MKKCQMINYIKNNKSFNLYNLFKNLIFPFIQIH